MGGLVQASNGHAWVAAVYLPMTLPQARYAERRGRIRLGEQPDGEGRIGVQAEVMEVSCWSCRKPFSEVYATPCSALDDTGRPTTEHLRGGPIGERKKRGPRPKTDVLLDAG